VLSCWQKDQWTYGTQTVSSVLALKDISGLQLAKVLIDVLEMAFGVPMIIRLGNAGGEMSLRSHIRSAAGVVDAGASTMYGDMQYLILASFVASRNVFAEATLSGETDEYNYPNLFKDVNG